MRLLDLYCGAGGASVGYSRAGFEVVGVDIAPQPNYPFTFYEGDALDWLNDDLNAWDAIHASPPCQAYSKTQRIRKREHPDLIGPTRELLDATGLPYVIENVPGAPLRDPLVLEGQMFEGLRTQRARWFETNWPLEVPFMRSPRPAPNAKMGRKARAHEWVGTRCRERSLPGREPRSNGDRLEDDASRAQRGNTAGIFRIHRRATAGLHPETRERRHEVITWAGYIRHNRQAVTCPWEIWETLPDGRKRFLGAYQTLALAEQAYR